MPRPELECRLHKEALLLLEVDSLVGVVHGCWHIRWMNVAAEDVITDLEGFDHQELKDKGEPLAPGAWCAETHANGPD
jgi:hypothetical protein